MTEDMKDFLAEALLAQSGMTNIGDVMNQLVTNRRGRPHSDKIQKGLHPLTKRYPRDERAMQDVMNPSDVVSFWEDVDEFSQRDELGNPLPPEDRTEPFDLNSILAFEDAVGPHVFTPDEVGLIAAHDRNNRGTYNPEKFNKAKAAATMVRDQYDLSDLVYTAGRLRKRIPDDIASLLIDYIYKMSLPFDKQPIQREPLGGRGEPRSY